MFLMRQIQQTALTARRFVVVAAGEQLQTLLKLETAERAALHPEVAVVAQTLTPQTEIVEMAETAAMVTLASLAGKEPKA